MLLQAIQEASRLDLMDLQEKQQTIEVEVVEIDGITPVPFHQAPETEAPHPRWQDWQKWAGRIRRLDARWWPLWLLLGIVLLFLFLTIGVIVAVVYFTYKIIRDVLLGIASLFK